uniref:Transmembrane protein n=1 Tax=Hanusia phi TaxID=3032 RepID=A0A7S0E2W6_9CRYP|mmetsp:Transcript_14898/g.34285  ORF Transcript_14898/g.34285 Transcript_14898/m.34285 type:complete len:371 (+) Transcript_14898:58-1170(+)
MEISGNICQFAPGLEGSFVLEQQKGKGRNFLRLAMSSALICATTLLCIYMIRGQSHVTAGQTALQQDELRREFRGAMQKLSSGQVAAEALRRNAWAERLSESRAHQELLRFGFSPPKPSPSRDMRRMREDGGRKHAEGREMDQRASGPDEAGNVSTRQMSLIKHASELGHELQKEREILNEALKDFHSKEQEYSKLKKLIHLKVTEGGSGGNAAMRTIADGTGDSGRQSSKAAAKSSSEGDAQPDIRDAHQNLVKIFKNQEFRRSSQGYVDAVYGLRDSESSRQGHNQLRGEMAPYSLQLEKAKRYLKELSSSDEMRQTDVESSYGGSYAGQSGQPYAAVSSPNKDVDELDARVQDARDGSYLDAVFDRQ